MIGEALHTSPERKICNMHGLIVHNKIYNILLENIKNFHFILTLINEADHRSSADKLTQMIKENPSRNLKLSIIETWLWPSDVHG